MSRSASFLTVLLLSACNSAEPAASLPSASREAAGAQIRFVQAESGEVAPLVQRFMAEADAESRAALVYVGATWCEPCQYFHRAAQAGELDEALPRMALLEFDLDEDAERLAAAGYASRMIPLFVVPNADGSGGPQRIEGSIHGPGSPQQIAPRLRALLPTP